jgi:hypothetical protein
MDAYSATLNHNEAGLCGPELNHWQNGLTAADTHINATFFYFVAKLYMRVHMQKRVALLSSTGLPDLSWQNIPHFH